MFNRFVLQGKRHEKDSQSCISAKRQKKSTSKTVQPIFQASHLVATNVVSQEQPLVLPSFQELMHSIESTKQCFVEAQHG